ASFTLSAWAQVPTLPTAWTAIAAKSRDAAPWYGLWIDDSAHWVAGGPVNITGIPASTGWSHVAVVQDGTAGARQLDVNGGAVASDVAQAATGTGQLWIGGSASVSEYFEGTIDEVRISNAARSPDWIAAEYASGGDAFLSVVSEGGTTSTNQPPVLSAIGNQTVNEGRAATCRAVATDRDAGQTLTYSLTAAPSGATINAGTGAFSWTPSEAQGPGSYTVTVRATDNGSPPLSDSKSLTITVNEVNQAPV